jgi:hypothetical protein
MNKSPHMGMATALTILHQSLIVSSHDFNRVAVYS